MSYKRQAMFSKRSLAAFLLTWNMAEAQSPETPAQNVTEVTSTTTGQDGTITGMAWVQSPRFKAYHVLTTSQRSTRQLL